eukprot:1620391-Alexandrium_andersonii.AAC.1
MGSYSKFEGFWSRPSAIFNDRQTLCVSACACTGLPWGFCRTHAHARPQDHTHAHAHAPAQARAVLGLSGLSMNCQQLPRA